AGASWQRISDQLPQHLWVARIQASAFEDGRVYAVLNGYRSDDFNAHLYVSQDYGQHWMAIGKDLPAEPLNVVKEDPANPDMLYVGSDHGLYVSLNRGQSFMRMQNGLPAVAVHDVVVQAREKELVVGTHGRSLYVASVREMQQLNEKIMGNPLFAFKPEDVRYSPRWGTAYADWMTAQEPAVELPLFLKEAGEVQVSVQDEKGNELYQFSRACTAGLNYLSYNLEMEASKSTLIEESNNAKLKEDEKPLRLKPAGNGKTYLYKGGYKLVFKKGDNQTNSTLQIK
ncbi:MAG: WD40/YVTN/BNR-like repeat-containing protein, partial [Haliscomenobacter sp.]